jgi:hypothetical protein
VREQKQRASAYPSSWDAPIFRSVFEERRLRILKALFTCLTRCGMTPRVSGKEGRELAVIVGDTPVPLVLDSIGSAKHIERERQGYGFTARGDKDRMRLSISNWWLREKPGPSWEDEPDLRQPKGLHACSAESREQVRPPGGNLEGGPEDARLPPCR